MAGSLLVVTVLVAGVTFAGAIHVRIVAIMCSNHRAYAAYILEEDGCHCHCQRGLLDAATIVKERGYNGGLLVAANNHCLMSKFGKFGSHHY